MKIKEVTQFLEEIAPLAYQESYDNSGLIVGDPNKEISSVLVCLDSLEEIVEEAILKNCELIVAHHPIVFSGLKKLTGKNYIERVIIKAIKNDIAIYACHTNLDNVLQNGVNQKIANKIGLKNQEILAPKQHQLRKLITYVPTDFVTQVQESLFLAGAGNIGNYDSCSFNNIGVGTYRANDKAKPFKGEIGELHQEEEVKVEVVYPVAKQSKILRALKENHPYEEVAYDIIAIENSHPKIGAGIVGDLPIKMETLTFLRNLKLSMSTNCVRYTKIVKPEIQRVAICGGAGSFLLDNAKAQQADVFITGDYKYHQFFDAEKDIVIADIGHYESEQFTIELLEDLLKIAFQTLKIVKTSVNTNPVNYL